MLSVKSSIVFSSVRILVDKYLNYLELKNVSQYTIRNYSYCLARFYSFVGKEDVTDEDILNFRLHLKRSGVGINWASFHIIVIREFFKYLYKQDIPSYPYYRIDAPKYVQTRIDVCSRNDLEKLFHVTEKDKLISLRNTAIIRTLYSTGLRVSELTGLLRYQVGPEMSVLGKGRKLRVVFMSKKALNAVEKYLDNRGDKYSPLFISHGRNKGKALTKEMVEKIVRTYAQRAGIMKVYPHKIRHSFATEMLRNGAPITAIQEILGHKSLRTTQLYTHITNPELQKAHQSFHR